MLELFCIQPRRKQWIKKKKRIFSIIHENGPFPEDAPFSWEGEDFVCHCHHLPKELSCSLQCSKDSRLEDKVWVGWDALAVLCLDSGLSPKQPAAFSQFLQSWTQQFTNRCIPCEYFSNCVNHVVWNSRKHVLFHIEPKQSLDSLCSQ